MNCHRAYSRLELENKDIVTDAWAKNEKILKTQSDAVRDFAKFIIDEMRCVGDSCGRVTASEIVDLHAEYQKKLKEN